MMLLVRTRRGGALGTAHCLALAVCVVVAMAIGSSASAKEPRVPPGLSPGGVAVALLGPGIDYRLPEIAKRLARDGEGDLISWDFTDNDTMPFDEAGPGTLAAMALAQLAPTSQLVIVKEQPGDVQSLGHMMTFVARTPARIIVWLDADPDRPDWSIFELAVKRFGDRLFVIPAIDRAHASSTTSAYQAAATANVLIAAGDTRATNGGNSVADVTVSSTKSKPLTSRDAALMMAAVAARALAHEPRRSMSELKQHLIKAAPNGIATTSGRLTEHEANSAFTTQFSTQRK